MYIARNLLRLRKRLTRHIFPSFCRFKDACRFRQEKWRWNAVRAERPCERATLGSLFGPTEKPARAFLQGHSARMTCLLGWENKKEKHARASLAGAKIQQNGAKCKSGRKNTNKEKRKKHCPYKGKWRGRFPGNGRRMPPQRGASFGMNCFVNLKSRVGCQLV